jgi:hypothetical protein
MTVNEQLLDADIGHQVNLHQYANGVVQRISALLNRVDADLFAQLSQALENLSVFNVERLDMLLSSVRVLNAAAYLQLERELGTEIRALAEYESGYQFKLFDTVIPAQIQVHVSIVPVNLSEVYAAAYAQPFRGRLLREWAASLAEDRAARIRDTIRLGYVEQQTVQQIVQRIRGTRAKGYSDGVIEIDRRNAESVVRTAVSHTAELARDKFYQGNDKMVKAVQWVSTLDTRTSEICRLRDGLQYTTDTHKPIGHKVPWLGGPGRAHWQCRSSSVPVLKSWRELGIDMDELTPSTRASMDGQVPAEQTYTEWLRKQSAARQDEVLGPSRGKWFRAGGLPMDRFYNDKGQFLTLAELADRESAAFVRAGVPLPA